MIDIKEVILLLGAILIAAALTLAYKLGKSSMQRKIQKRQLNMLIFGRKSRDKIDAYVKKISPTDVDDELRKRGWLRDND